MTRLIANLLVGLIVLGWTLSAHAVRYGASFNQAEWRLELSPFECRMWQPVPSFGDAVFSNKAGESQSFYLEPVSRAMKAGRASLMATAPLWDESRSSVDMGTVEVNDTGKPVILGEQRAYQLLNELYDGMSLHLCGHPGIRIMRVSSYSCLQLTFAKLMASTVIVWRAFYR